jgi:hypothetical protein
MNVWTSVTPEELYDVYGGTSTVWVSILTKQIMS